MALPAVLLVFLISYIPMAGIILAFKDYRFDLGVFGSHWNGFENFKYFFNSGTGLRVTRNTILYNLLNLITSQLFAVMIAIFIHEMRGKYFKKVSQSIIFLPFFISWTIVGVFVYNIFNYETGTLNSVLKALHMAPVNLYETPSIWIVIICFFKLVEVGRLYVGHLYRVDPQHRLGMLRSGQIDGANVFQKVFYITIPSISPTIFIMFLLNIGRILRGDFQMFYRSSAITASCSIRPTSSIRSSSARC